MLISIGYQPMCLKMAFHLIRLIEAYVVHISYVGLCMHNILCMYLYVKWYVCMCSLYTIM